MDVISSIEEMRQDSARARARGQRIGLVPTLGALHEGHLSLVRVARERTDRVVVSVFVNPTQFGEGEDLECYPRDLERDTALCREEGVAVVFAPSAREMYPAGHSVYVDEQDVSTGLCGASRPGHFRGVLTVVAKLLNIVGPDIAVFGQKDAQQACLVRRMVTDLDIPMGIVVAPIVREEDGLAMSSRNRYLSPEERKRATCLYRALCLARQLVEGGVVDTGVIRERMRALIDDGAPPVAIEYIEIVDNRRLKPVDCVEGETLVAVAARVGSARLIDNVVVKPACS